MKGLCFEDFKKSLQIGHEIEIRNELTNFTYWIFVYEFDIDYNIYSDIYNKEKEKFYGTFTFKPKEYTNFENMIEEFLDFKFIDNKSLNEIQENIVVDFSTAGY